jgi:hypothetical protein
VKPTEVAPTARRSVLPPLVCLAVQIAAWGMLFLGRWRVSQLDLSAFGQCTEVFEALARDGYVVEHFLPFAAAAYALSFLVLPALAWAALRGRPVVLVGALGVVWLLSVGLHGIILVSALAGPL